MTARPLPSSVLALAVAMAGASAPGAAADLFDAGTPFVRSYVVSDGLPQNTVHSLMLDREGLLWAGTQDGVARYDGRTWRDVVLPTRGRSSFVRDLLEEPNGDLWVATQAGGLLRRRGADWTVYDPETSALPDLRVNALARSETGARRSVWVGTHTGGLARIEGDEWRVWTERDGLPGNQIWALLVVPDSAGDKLWIATEAGPAWLALPDGPIVVPEGGPKASCNSLEWLPDAGGGAAEVWIGTYGNGLWKHGAGSWSHLEAGDGLPSDFVTDLARRPEDDRALWVATDGGGLALLHDGAVESVPLGPEFSSSAAYRVLETTSEQGAAAVWVGTRNNGLLRLMTGYWRSFVPSPEIPRSPIASLLVADDAPGGPELWLGTDGFGLARWKQGEWRRFDRDSGALGNDAVFALAETRRLGARRQIWAATRNGGLSAWDGSTWRRYDREGGELPSDLVQTLLPTSGPDTEERLWVGTREGLARFDGRRWEALSAADGWPESSILALLEDRDEESRWALWIGTSTGLYRDRGGELRRWGEEEGLSNPAVHSLHVRRLADGRRQLWLGTDGGGVFVLDPDQDSAKLVSLASLGFPELPNGVIYAILEDREGRLYLPTNRGVVRIEPGARPDDLARLELLTVDHGLPSSQASRGAATVDDRGRIWVGTVSGAAALDPEAEPSARVQKRILLEARLGDGSGAPIEPGARIEHGGVRFTFRYALLSFFGEPLTRYRTQLAGWEETPTEWTASSERELGGLPPGSYTFRVWGRDAAGRVSGPRQLAFAVEPELWQTTTARIAGVLTLALLVVALMRARARVHVRREKELEELVAARTARLQRANALLIELSYVDALTAIPNRRRFDELLDSEWKRAVRAHTPIAVAMVDIDHFKAYNDSSGHQKGDDCLRQVAAALADGLSRSGDAIARYGGEEFAVILPHTDREGAIQVADHLRRRIQSLEIAHHMSELGGVVTVSCGVASARPELGGDPQALLTDADRALYEAKRMGRNRVEAAD